MSDAVSQHGFTVARRGYAMEQVDATLRALTADRDEAWERLSVLGAGLREMEKRLGEILRAKEDAPEPDYGQLSAQAGALMLIAENEAAAVRDNAARDAEQAHADAEQAGRAAARSAEGYSATVRGEAEQAARATEDRSRAEAESILDQAEQDARTTHDTATADAARTRVAAAEAEERAEAKLAELRRRSDEMFAEAEAQADAEEAKITSGAERRLREAEQHREDILAEIRAIEGAAQKRAEELLSAARRKAENIRSNSEQDQSDFAGRHAEMQERLDTVKKTLAELTGAALGSIEPGSRPAALEAAAKEANEPELTLDLLLKKPLPTADAPAAGAAGAAEQAPAEAAEAAAPAEDAAEEPEAEQKIVPKIVIVDDGIDHDTRPSRVTRRG
ncbi:hypothetical protein [Kitasatospora sp. DSM 101779]|uniref:hypothetical protein n=1 Tax=Kitasatospora sp. DSM 101779 TaxID=2853165 RepID=UPI0021D8CD8B|nr:hypothetical protein [Kitasatospora sp. DSM 101779]MCU7823136.1 hypothetical protein [Kitasatospora sp. DSM 101779]